MMRPPTRKIVRIIARLNVGGPARHAVILSKGLEAAGFETLLVYGSLAEGEGSLESLVHEQQVRGIRLPELGRRISPFSDLRALARILAVLRGERPDIVHTHTSKAGVLGRLAALLYNLGKPRRRRCLVVHTYHGHVLKGYFGPVRSWLACVAERALALVTDVVVTLSPLQRNEIVGRFRVAPDERVVVVPLGLNLTALETLTGQSFTLRRQLRVPDEAVLFGYLGRLVPIKDLDTLLKAFALVRKSEPRAHLAVIGDGGLRERLQAVAAALGLGRCVHFTGWLDDLPVVHGSIDVMVLSSLNEGTPVALIEAMAAGRPTVATAVGGVPDVVQDGQTGILVPSSDPLRLAQAMLGLARDAELRARLGAAGRVRSNRFRAERLLRDLAELYTRRLALKRGLLQIGSGQVQEASR